MDSIRKKRRLIVSGWLLAAGVTLPLLGLWFSTWEEDHLTGSVWNFINQRDERVEPWSALAIQVNLEYLITAALLILAGLTCLIVGLVIMVRTLRRQGEAL